MPISNHDQAACFLIDKAIISNKLFSDPTITIFCTPERARFLYDLATSKVITTPNKSNHSQIVFRSSALLERIYFCKGEYFDPFIEEFKFDFSNTHSESAKRHFLKIMIDLIKNSDASSKFPYEQIAESCIEWITQPNAKAAVIIWATELLIMIRPKVDWLPGLLPEIIEPLKRFPHPSIVSRLRYWHEKNPDLK